MAKAKHSKSLRPDDLVESKFFRGGTATCVKSRYVVHRHPNSSAKKRNKGDGNPFDAKYHAKLFAAFWLHSSDPEVEIDPTKPAVYHSVGSLNHWRPSNDGFTPLVTDPDQLDQSWLDLDTEEERLASEGIYLAEVDDEGNPVTGEDGELLNPDYKSKFGVNKNSNLGEFIDWSCKEGGFPLSQMDDNSGVHGTSSLCWEGVEAVWEPVPQKGGQINPKTDLPYTIMVITNVVNTGIDVSKYAGGSTSAAMSDADDTSGVADTLQTKIAELLGNNGNSMTQSEVLQKIGDFGISRIDIAIGLMAADGDFLGGSDRWTFDKATQRLTLTAA